MNTGKVTRKIRNYWKPRGNFEKPKRNWNESMKRVKSDLIVRVVLNLSGAFFVLSFVVQKKNQKSQKYNNCTDKSRLYYTHSLKLFDANIL